MNTLTSFITVVHIFISVIVIVVDLMQHGKTQGLSGSIAGGAESFFGKNKGRTIDGILSKWTSVVAVIFIITSVALTLLK